MIKRARLCDAKKIADIEFFSGYKWRMKKESELKMARKILKSQESKTYILENKRPIGYFVVRFKNSISYIDFFAVIKSKQKKGVGSILMNKIIRMSKKNKCKKANVTVWAKNFPAIALYNKFGFYVVGIKKRHYPNGDDKLTMEKEI